MLFRSNASRALFSLDERTEGEAIPTTYIDRRRIDEGIPVFKLFETASLCASGSEARRLIEQGGAYINNHKVGKFDDIIKLDDFGEKGEMILRAGKKKYHRIKLKTS